MVAHTIQIPNSLELLLSLPILICRQFRHGYTFRLIPLTKGKFAKVSPRDYPVMMKYKWCARRTPQTFYASFYRNKNGRQKIVSMHNLIMTPPAGFIVDHIDGDGLNNCRPNLRLATPAQNSRNTRAKVNGISKYKGVCPEKRRKCWRATLTVDGKQIHVGQFKSEIEAAKAYDVAAKKYHGKFARLNFPLKKTGWKETIEKLRNLPKH
jgi:hypothetical protein